LQRGPGGFERTEQQLMLVFARSFQFHIKGIFVFFEAIKKAVPVSFAFTPRLRHPNGNDVVTGLTRFI
jgi:hypothetical protein